MANEHATLTSLFGDIAEAIREGFYGAEYDALPVGAGITIPADYFPDVIRGFFCAKKKSLNNCSWEFIRWASDAGVADLFWSIGDRKAVTLSEWGATGKYAVSAGTYYCYIIGFDHNSTKEGTKRIHFEFGFNALSGGTHIAFCGSDYGLAWSNTNPYYIRMNSSKTNNGGWESSLMRTGTLNGTNRSFSTAVPADLRAVLKTVNKYTDNVGGGSGNVKSNVTRTTDTFFILNSMECRGEGTMNSYEKDYTAQYQYYKNGNDKSRYKSNDSGTICNFIFRSCHPSNGTNFAAYNTAGSSVPANTVYAISPCFCV